MTFSGQYFTADMTGWDYLFYVLSVLTWFGLILYWVREGVLLWHNLDILSLVIRATIKAEPLSNGSPVKQHDEETEKIIN